MSASFNEASDIETLEKLAIQIQRNEQLMDALEESGAFKAAGWHKVISFCCACCRLIEDELPAVAQEALYIAEQYNADLVSQEEVEARKTQLSALLYKDPIFCFKDPKFGSSKLTKAGEGARAVLGCLASLTNQLDNEHELVYWTMDSCEKAKSGLEDIEYQMLLDYFGSGAKTNG